MSTLPECRWNTRAASQELYRAVYSAAVSVNPTLASPRYDAAGWAHGTEFLNKVGWKLRDLDDASDIVIGNHPDTGGSYNHDSSQEEGSRMEVEQAVKFLLEEYQYLKRTREEEGEWPTIASGHIDEAIWDLIGTLATVMSEALVIHNSATPHLWRDDLLAAVAHLSDVCGENVLGDDVRAVMEEATGKYAVAVLREKKVRALASEFVARA